MIPIFDPVRTFTVANESDTPTLEISYHAEEPVTIVDGDDYVDDDYDDALTEQFLQQLEDIEAIFPTSDEVDEYKLRFEQNGGICRQDIVSLEAKYPGLFVNLGYDLESFTYLPSNVGLTSAVESLDAMKSVSLVVVIIGILVKLVMWFNASNNAVNNPKYSDDVKRVIKGELSVEEYISDLAKKAALYKALGGEVADETLEELAKYFGVDMDKAKAAVGNGKLSSLLAITDIQKYKALSATPIMSDGERLVKYLNGFAKGISGSGDKLQHFLEALPKAIKSIGSKNDHSVDTDDSRFDTKMLPDSPNDFFDSIGSACSLQLTEKTVKEYTVKIFTEAEFKELVKSVSIPGKVEKRFPADKLTAIDDIDKTAAAAITFISAASRLSKSIKVSDLKKELADLLKEYKDKAERARKKMGNKLGKVKDALRDGEDDPKEGEDTPASESKWRFAIEAVNMSGDGTGQHSSEPVGGAQDPNSNLMPDDNVAKNTFTKLMELLQEQNDQLRSTLIPLSKLSSTIMTFYSTVENTAKKLPKKAKPIDEPK